jgi:hypothetical protein
MSKWPPIFAVNAKLAMQQGEAMTYLNLADNERGTLREMGVLQSAYEDEVASP